MKLTFWGSRGSIPSPYPSTINYGGNTACIEIRTRDQNLFVLDAGTGIRKLGLKLVQESSADGRILEGKVDFVLSRILRAADAVDIPDSLKALKGEKSFQGAGHIFLSHNHWDHIQGFPFFVPAFIQGFEFIIYGRRKEKGELNELFAGQMSKSYFPVHFDQLGADIRFKELKDGEVLTIGDTIIKCLSLNHPQGCMGYRFTCGEVSIAYLTDNEHSENEIDKNVLELARGAKLMIYDAQYTPEEYEQKKGWGHSTWEMAARISKEVEVEQVALFHHDPEHDDEFLSELESKIQKQYPNIFMAKEGLELIYPAFEETDFKAVEGL